jgi:hypothetical protein
VIVIDVTVRFAVSSSIANRGGLRGVGELSQRRERDSGQHAQAARELEDAALNARPRPALDHLRVLGEALEVTAQQDLHTAHVDGGAEDGLVAGHVEFVDRMGRQIEFGPPMRRDRGEEGFPVVGSVVLDRRELLPHGPPVRSQTEVRCSTAACMNTCRHLGQPRHLTLDAPGPLPFVEQIGQPPRIGPTDHPFGQAGELPMPLFPDERPRKLRFPRCRRSYRLAALRRKGPRAGPELDPDRGRPTREDRCVDLRDGRDFDPAHSAPAATGR